jgi:hypothetical protein
MTGSSLFTNLARTAKLLALLFLFLLPFVAVSCSPQAMMEASRADAARSGNATPVIGQLPGGGRDCTILTANGLQLVSGNWQPSRECFQGLGGEMPRENRPDANSPFGQPDYFVIGAAALILLSLLATVLLKGGSGAVAAIGGCALALCLLLYDVLMRWPGIVRAEAARSPNMGGGGGGPTPEQMAQILQAKPQIGFWLVALALIAAIVLNAMAARRPNAAVAPPPAV